MSMKRIGTLLLEKGLIAQDDLDQALRLQAEVGGLLGQALLRIGALSEDDLLLTLQAQLDLPILRAQDLPQKSQPFEQACKSLDIPAKWLRVRNCALWTLDGKTINGIASNILDPELQERIEAQVYAHGLDYQEYLASNQILEAALHTAYPKSDMHENAQGDEDTQRLREMAEGAPVIDFVNRVFSTALKDNASDIHIEPFEHKFQVRYRIDGVLHTKQTEPRSQFDAVASRVKLLSGMDIAERRLPQDGRQTIRFSGQDIDLRVSSLPGSWGESLVLRLLRKEQELLDLESLGLEGRAKTVLQDLLSHPNGVILVTGPTGSGKSTTLYRSLLGLNDGIRKIITIEDPVEYDMDGIIQIQTKANIGYTFAKGLRAILRQDPDIIMVGEIRDGETATIAAQAALTGHLVLSTLHTNSALAAVARLIDIGLEPYMVASAVRGLAAQRLVRRLCPHCKTAAHNQDGEDLIWEMAKRGGLNANDIRTKAQWAEPKGCDACSHTGYLGRVAIFEVAKIDDALSDAILQQYSLRKLVQTARTQGFMTLMEDGALKARAGITTMAEVMRVCGNDDQGLDEMDYKKKSGGKALNLYPPA